MSCSYGQLIRVLKTLLLVYFLCLSTRISYDTCSHVFTNNKENKTWYFIVNSTDKNSMFYSLITSFF